MTPEAGPDITVFAASRATRVAVVMPPLPVMTRRSRRKPRAREVGGEAGEVAVEQGLDGGVDGAR